MHSQQANVIRNRVILLRFRKYSKTLKLHKDGGKFLHKNFIYESHTAFDPFIISFQVSLLCYKTVQSFI